MSHKHDYVQLINHSYFILSDRNHMVSSFCSVTASEQFSFISAGNNYLVEDSLSVYFPVYSWGRRPIPLKSSHNLTSPILKDLLSAWLFTYWRIEFVVSAVEHRLGGRWKLWSSFLQAGHPLITTQSMPFQLCRQFSVHPYTFRPIPMTAQSKGIFAEGVLISWVSVMASLGRSQWEQRVDSW